MRLRVLNRSSPAIALLLCSSPIMALHLPPSKRPPPPPPPSELQRWAGHLELALENRLDLLTGESTGYDALKAMLDAVSEARKEMGW